jgi:hypothetical protein
VDSWHPWPVTGKSLPRPCRQPRHIFCTLSALARARGSAAPAPEVARPTPSSTQPPWPLLVDPARAWCPQRPTSGSPTCPHPFALGFERRDPWVQGTLCIALGGPHRSNPGDDLRWGGWGGCPPPKPAPVWDAPFACTHAQPRPLGSSGHARQAWVHTLSPPPWGLRWRPCSTCPRAPRDFHVRVSVPGDVRSPLRTAPDEQRVKKRHGSRQGALRRFPMGILPDSILRSTPRFILESELDSTKFKNGFHYTVTQSSAS